MSDKLQFVVGSDRDKLQFVGPPIQKTQKATIPLFRMVAFAQKRCARPSSAAAEEENADDAYYSESAKSET